MDIDGMKKKLTAEAKRKIKNIETELNRKLEALKILGADGDTNVSKSIRDLVPSMTGTFTAKTVNDKLSEAGVKARRSHVSNVLSKLYATGQISRVQVGVRGESPSIYAPKVEAPF